MCRYKVEKLIMLKDASCYGYGMGYGYRYGIGMGMVWVWVWYGMGMVWVWCHAYFDGTEYIRKMLFLTLK